MPIGDLRDVQETLEALLQLHERAEVRQLGYLPTDLLTHLMLFDELIPDIRSQLLETERQALTLDIDVEDRDFDLLSLLQDLRRVFDALRPRHVGDVNQTVDSVLDSRRMAPKSVRLRTRPVIT